MWIFNQGCVVLKAINIDIATERHCCTQRGAAVCDRLCQARLQHIAATQAMPKAAARQQQEQELPADAAPRRRKPPALASAVSGAVSGAVISACVQVWQPEPPRVLMRPGAVVTRACNMRVHSA